MDVLTELPVEDVQVMEWRGEPENTGLLLRLPFEVLRRILVEYVGPEGTAMLRQTGKRMNDLCSTDDIWKDFCCKELRLRPKDLNIPYKYWICEDESAHPQIIPSELYDTAELKRGSPLSFMDAYTQLIHPFRGLLNWFLVSRGSTWDDILTITFENGLLHGEIWQLSKDLTAPMIPVSDFTLFIEEETERVLIRNDFIFTILSAPEVPLKKLITTGFRPPAQRPTHAVFTFRSHRHHARRWKMIQDFITAQGISWPASSSNQRPFEGPLAYSKLEDMFDMTDVRAGGRQHSARMFYPHRAVMQPPLGPFWSSLPSGLFKGAFGPIGNQLITVVWGRMPGASDAVTDFLTGIKTTGHLHRPAGTCLFLFKIANQIVCTSTDDQKDPEKLEAMAHGPFVKVPSGCTVEAVQPFKMPAGVQLPLSLDANLIPDTCTARFVGQGAMASRTDEHVNFDVPAHMIVFSPTRFMVLWLGLVKVAVLFEKISTNDKFCKYV
ncbi:uncharacterized protein LOC129587746 [Paramacrobiotus metropolitanus]|uniref:uncharacterized protein LOC129587746 n=1 Tax=Paramacrobiotus metropolitanus TaxID=2943436 RepID=UPI00244596A4|nr:uncharacterized protein LOC129587746 [Paramacrobiotus metropolitanus]